MFAIKSVTLPHPGTIPGARGHKKIVVPKGTAVYVIECQRRYFWCAYLREESAAKCLEGFEANLKSITLDTLLAFNFKANIPSRIHREKYNELDVSSAYGG